MHVMTVIGTRPEIIRLSGVIGLLDVAVEHTLVHTGQNYDDRLDGLFFRELGVREPNVNLGVRAASFGEQVGQILTRVENVLRTSRPDRLLILGDTNSGLASIVARRLGIPVFHAEAGNRCFDDRVPEEVNRRLIDHASSVLMPYTNRSRDNLLREGIPSKRVFVVGNPIKQVMDTFAHRIAESNALATVGVQPGQFFLVTMHRAENVDRADRLRDLVESLRRIREQYKMPVICSLHPRARAQLEQHAIDVAPTGVQFVQPLGFFDFVRLEQAALCVLSDSGTVQEEACILGTPNVTIREVTERPETVECGSNFLAGTSPDSVCRAVAQVIDKKTPWAPPPEYLVANSAETICRIVTSFHLPDRAELEWQQDRPRAKKHSR